MKRSVWLIAVVLLVTLAACAKPPQAEIDSARAKVAEVDRNSEVSAYAPDTLARAKNALARMEQELAAKKYDAVKAAAAEAIAAAEQAPADARAAKERTRTQAVSLIEEAKKAIASVRANASAAARQRIAGLDSAAIQTEIGAAATSISRAETDLNSANFISARDGAASAQAAIADIERRIAEAVQNARRKK